MIKSKLYDCVDCGASFKVLHDLDSTVYHVNNCPFCGETLDQDNMFDFDEEEEEDND